GSHTSLYDKLGAHPRVVDGVAGTHFAVWAPGAQQVYVMGDFNRWAPTEQPLQPRANSGIWEGFVPGVGRGAHYKDHVVSRDHSSRVDKAAPSAFGREVPPKTASIVWPLDYTWNDDRWLARRQAANSLSAPIAIYEVHLGSWRHVPGEGNRSLSYR